MSRYLNRAIQTIISVIYLLYYLLYSHPDFSNIYSMLFSLPYILFPCIIIFSKNAVFRLASSITILSVLLNSLSNDIYMLIIFSVLYIFSIDMNLRDIKRYRGNLLGIGFFTILSIVLLEYCLYRYVFAQYYSLIVTLTYFLTIFVYEVIRVGGVEYIYPSEVYLDSGELMNIKIIVKNVGGLNIDIFEKEFRYRFKRIRDGYMVNIYRRADKIGRKRFIVHLIISGSRKFIVYRKEIVIYLNVKPKLEKALRKAYKLAFELLPRFSEAREIVETGGKPGYIKTAPYGLRPYIPGDDVRYINYKKSLNKLELVINEYSSGDVYIEVGSRKIFSGELSRSILILVDLSSNSLTEFDERAYRFLSLITDLIEIGLTPKIVIIVVGENILYSSRGLNAQVLLRNMINILSKIFLYKYREYIIEDGVAEFTVPELFIKQLFLKQALMTSKTYVLLQKYVKNPEDWTIIVIRPPKRRTQYYSYLNNIFKKRGFNIIEYKV